MNMRTVMGWSAILVAVDILIAMLVASWAIGVLPEGWWSVGPQALLIVVVLGYVAVIGALMLVGYCIKSTAGSIYSKLCTIRSRIHTPRYYPIYVPMSGCPCACEDNYEEDSEEEAVGYAEGYEDGYADGRDSIETPEDDVESAYGRGYSEGFKAGYSLDVRNR